MKKLCLFFSFACSFIVFGMQDERGLSGSGGGSSDLLIDTYMQGDKPILNDKIIKNDVPTKKSPSIENLRRSRENFERRTDIKLDKDAIQKAQARRTAERKAKEEQNKKK